MTRSTFVCALALAGCVGPLGTTSEPATPPPAMVAPVTPPAPTSTLVCDPANIPAGATWTPVPVTCPVAPDTAALAVCSATGAAALVTLVPYTTVQGAIDAAPAGGTIQVCPGTYAEALTIGDGKVVAAVDPSDGVTALDLYTSTGELTTATIDGGTLRGFTMALPAIVAHGDVTLECLVSTSSATAVTHALGNGTLTIRHSRFSGGVDPVVRIDGGGAVVVEDSEFADNQVMVSVPEGGALRAAGGPVTVRRTAFLRNRSGSAYGRGGAIAIVPTEQGGGLASLVVEDSWFEDNESPGEQAGAIFVATGSLAISGTTFLASVVPGGGASAVQAMAGVQSCTITDTTFALNRGGAAVSCSNDIVLERVRFEDNSDVDDVRYPSADNGAGAAVLNTNTAAVTGVNVVAHRNSSFEAAVWLQDSASFDCVCCDFGAGADDNTPVDLLDDGVVTDDLGTDFGP